MPKAPKNKPSKLATRTNFQGVNVTQEFSAISNFLGYRSREDKTILPYGTMIHGSQNVLIDITGRLKSRQGFTLDGQANSSLTPIYASYDWEEHLNGVLNFRAYSGNLQFRWVDTNGNPVWTTIQTGLGTEHIRFTNYWHDPEVVNCVLFVDGSKTVYRWNGGIATLASVSNNTPIIQSLVIDNAGTGYVIGDVLTIPGGTGGTATVGNIGGGGAITVLNIQYPGYGYSVATNVPLGGGSGTSATANITIINTNSVTLQGGKTWAELGFYVNNDLAIVIGGTTYVYTAGWTTDTLTGLSLDPTIHGYSVGDLIYQQVEPLSKVTSVPTDFTFDGISNVQNQIYYANESNNNIYLSKVNDYTDCTFTSPVRVVGQGALITLRAPWVAFEPQEDSMYISAGLSQWYQTKSTLSSDNSKEDFTVTPLKTSAKQGALAQESITHDRNSIVLLSNETRLLSLGRTVNIFGTPMMTDYSYPVAKDFNLYDWTDASIKFWKSYIFIALPVEGKWLIFNQTDPNNVFWEAPQTGSFSGFSEIEGNIYAHGYNVPETYKLFDGYNDNGAPILSRATFSYYDYQSKGLSKYFNEFWVEGYISPNTNLKTIYNFDLDGCATKLTGTLDGSNSTVVCTLPDSGSLGKSPLGKNPLGGIMQQNDPDPLPPYFGAIFVTPRKDFYKLSPVFESYGTDYHWELISFGPLVTETMFGSNNLKISLA